jgi:streptomycin 6-kinase
MAESYSDHPGLQWLNASDAGRQWLRALDRIVGECKEEWCLTIEEPFSYAFTSLALPVQLNDGTPAVLKIQFPDRESQFEMDALVSWAGNGATRLFAADEERRALLLERCFPGTPLADAGPEVALGVLTDLVERLSIPTQARFPTLADEAAYWSGYLETRWENAGKPFEFHLVEVARGFIHELAGSPGDPVLLNQDLHARNVLRAERELWLVIDPKPLVGEREFAIASIVRDDELGHDEGLLKARFEILVKALHLDRERALKWTVAQTIAWSITPEGARPNHLDVARWLLTLA